MSVTLRNITENDLENIMKWRMAPDITRYMNTDPVLTFEGQLRWLAAINANTDVRYWIIEIDGRPAGVINLTGLDREDGELGWAYYVGEKSLRSFKTALELELNLYEYALVELGKKSVTADVFSLNKGVIALHEYCGCKIVEEKKNAVCKNDVWYDVTYMVMTCECWMEFRKSIEFDKIVFAE